MNKIIASFSCLLLSFCLSAQSTEPLTKALEGSLKPLKDGITYSYTIHLKKGQYLEFAVIQQGVDLMIDLYGPDGKVLRNVDSPTGSAGAETLMWPAETTGIYRAKVLTYDMSEVPDSAMRAAAIAQNTGQFKIDKVDIISAKEYQARLAARDARRDSISAWVSLAGKPLKSVTAGAGFEDLQWLKPRLKDVKVVGLGEATHGTREFFQMKHRMLEFLVVEMGFRVFVIEASYSACFNINDYVMYGKGDRNEALASQGFWTWNTQEVAEMMDWMKAYNVGKADKDKVKFLGMDIQVNETAHKVVGSYFEQADPYHGKEWKAALDSLNRRIQYTTKEAYEGHIYEINRILAALVNNKGLYTQRTSQAAYDKAFDNMRILSQTFDAMDNDSLRLAEREWRDYYMADNMLDLMAKESPDTKFVVWAHNGHVSEHEEAFVNGGLKPFGAYMKDAFGDGYFVFGFSFSEGGFQAGGMKDGSWKLQEFVIQPPPEGALGQLLSQSGLGRFIIPLDDIKIPQPAKNYFNGPVCARNIGSGFAPSFLEWEKRCIEDPRGGVVPMEAYDAIIFIEKTTRAEPVKK